MTTKAEIESMADRLNGHASIRRDESGYPVGITVTGVRGFGPCEMPPIQFVEAMRARLAIGQCQDPDAEVNLCGY